MVDNAYSIAPSTNFILAMCEADLGWRNALGELIDNALDAGAKYITIELGPNRQKHGAQHILIEDDGDGCNNLIGFLTPGVHLNPKAKLGRYGVGFKDAVLYLGGPDSRLELRSTHGGTTRRVCVDWRRLVSSGSWSLADNEVDVPRPQRAGEHGTRIYIAPVVRSVPDGKSWDELLEHLGYMYTPAIKRGAHIIIRGKKRGADSTELKRFELPSFEQHIHEDVAIDGKRATVHVGIVQEGVINRRPGITYMHGFRVIEPACCKGCGPYDPSRIAGFVELDRGWKLHKNKNGISHGADDLYAAVFRLCEPLLKRAETSAQQLQCAALANAIEDTVNQLLGAPDAKAKRSAGDKHGRKYPTGDAGKHHRAKTTQSGDRFPHTGGRVRIVFNPVPGEESIGHYDPNGTVILNSALPVIHRMQKDGNKLGLVMLALALIDVGAVLRPEDIQGQRLMRKVDGDNELEKFSRLYGKMLSRVALNGEVLISAEATP